MCGRGFATAAILKACRFAEQGAGLVLPCITKDESTRIIEEFAKGNAGKKDRALDALKRAQQFKVVITPESATQE
jgi:hypothetical protein